MRFLADMGVSLRFVDWLRQRSHDVVHLFEVGLERLPDESILQKAQAENRIILTFDLDFGCLLALGPDLAVSVVLFRLNRAKTDYVISRFEVVLREATENLLNGSIIVVEDGRHRIRKLPIKT